jgi:gas vesicle protein
MENNKKRSDWKFWIGLGVGVAAGMAAGYFANSDEGRVMRRRTQKRLDKWSRKTSKNLRKEVNNLTEKVNELLDKTKDFAGKATNTVKEKMDNFVH